MNNRSKWKGFYVDQKILKNFKKTQVIITTSRKSSIIPKFIGKIFSVHSGKKFFRITILKEMVGHKLGEFVSTRSKFTFKKKKKKR